MLEDDSPIRRPDPRSAESQPVAMLVRVALAQVEQRAGPVHTDGDSSRGTAAVAAVPLWVHGHVIGRTPHRGRASSPCTRSRRPRAWLAGPNNCPPRLVTTGFVANGVLVTNGGCNAIPQQGGLATK